MERTIKITHDMLRTKSLDELGLIQGEFQEYFLGSNDDYPHAQPYVGSDLYIFDESLGQAMYQLKTEGTTTPRFLECGCGLPILSMLAQKEGCEVEGIENNYFIVKALQYMGFDFPIHLENLLGFERYGEFDIIQFFYPFSEFGLGRQFETKITHTMKYGTFVITQMYSNKRLWRESPYYEQLSQFLFRRTDYPV